MASKKSTSKSSKPRGKSSLKTKDNEVHFIFSGQIGTSMTASNAAGAFVGTRIEVDTDFCAKTVILGAVFEQWNLHWLELKYRPEFGSTTVGETGHCMLKDPADTVPSSGSACSDLSQSPAPVHVYEKCTQRYNPGKGWLYCKDSGVSDDRLEMPGDVVFWNEGCAAAQVMGTLHYKMSISFRNFVPSAVNLNRSDPDGQAKLFVQLLTSSDDYRIPERKIKRWSKPKLMVDGKQVVQQLDYEGHVIGEETLTITDNVVTAVEETSSEVKPSKVETKKVVSKTKKTT